MPSQRKPHHPYEDIDQRLAAILRLLSESYRQKEIAEHLGIAESTVNRLVAELKQLTGCRNPGELGRWWRANQVNWIRHQADLAGVDLSQLAV